MRNTNFASQKYEILNHIIQKAFLPSEGKRKMTHLDGGPSGNKSSIGDHHSLATVTLDNSEEEQFRAVTWSVLYAMAEESLPPTILKLAFVEIPARLFESLFLMANNGVSEFRLNSLALMHRLFVNGLSFTGHSSKRDSLPKTLHTILPKTGLMLLAKFRSSLFRSALMDNTNTPHLCAIDGLLKCVLKEADLHHFAMSCLLVASLQDHARVRSHERQALVAVLLNGYLSRIGLLLGIPGLSKHAKQTLAEMRSRKIHVFELDDAFDEYPPPLCLRTGEDPKLDSYYLTFERLRELLKSSENFEESQLAVIDEVFAVVPYSPEHDMENYRDASRTDAGRRSLFPASPKRPLLDTESNEGTILAHRRSLVSIFGQSDSMTVPTYASGPFTKHRGNSSVSVNSQISRTSSLKKPGYRMINASTDNLSVSSDDGSIVSVLDGDFADLTLRNQEKKREIRERSVSFLK